MFDIKKIKILHLEDSIEDVELQNEKLRMDGFDVESFQVFSREDFLKALDQSQWNIILADNSMPNFDGLSALQIFKEKNLDIPFIFVSGTLGEEVAIEALKNGATDYVLKQRLNRLLPVVRRALLDVENRREREEYFRSLIENVSDIITVIDNEGIIRYESPSVENLLGYKPEELIGKEFFFLVHPEDQLKALNAFAYSKKLQNDSLRLEIRCLHKDGNWRIFDSIGRTFVKGKDQFIGVINSRDVTEQKQAQAQLAYQAHILENMNDAVLASDENFVINAWNQAAEKMYGWKAEEVFGLAGSDVLKPIVFEQNRAQYIKTLYETGELYIEIPQHHKNGSQIWVGSKTVALRNEEGKITGFISVNRNISDRIKAEEKIKQQIQRLNTLRKIDQSIVEGMGLESVLRTALKLGMVELGVDAAVLLLYHPQEQSLKYELEIGMKTNALQFTHLKLGEGYAGKAAKSMQTITILNLQKRTTDFLRSPSFSLEGFVCYFGVPLVVKGEIKGVLEIFHRAPLKPEQEWLDFMEIMARQIAIAIDNAQLLDGMHRSNVELTEAYDATILGWSHAMDLRDKETEGHTQRVTELTLKLANRLGIDEQEQIHIRRGALLHDIGKLGVPDHILLKDGPLTDAEWVIMRQHPQYAYDMLSSISYIKPALDIPYCHHEKWDGSGYPRGLPGEQIPLSARIFTIVDVWDALRSDRPYRLGWPIQKVREYILEQSGKHFEPRIVQEFFSLIEDLPDD